MLLYLSLGFDRRYNGMYLHDHLPAKFVLEISGVDLKSPSSLVA